MSNDLPVWKVSSNDVGQDPVVISELPADQLLSWIEPAPGEPWKEFELRKAERYTRCKQQFRAAERRVHGTASNPRSPLLPSSQGIQRKL